MDAKRYKIADRAFSRRAERLSTLDDPTEQQREVGIVAAALEELVNQKNWPLVERLTVVLLKLREAQQRARERAGELVDLNEFKRVLNQTLDIIANRIREACPNGYEQVIDLIVDDILANMKLGPQPLETPRT